LFSYLLKKQTSFCVEEVCLLFACFAGRSANQGARLLNHNHGEILTHGLGELMNHSSRLRL